MIVTRLKLANLRAIVSTEFRFQPGVNLIVGRGGWQHPLERLASMP
jgi:hypothetical protein